MSEGFGGRHTALGAGGASGILPSKLFKAQWDNKSTDVSKKIDDIPYNMNPPASMGPWIFKSFQPGVQVTFTKNDKYFRGTPLIDELDRVFRQTMPLFAAQRSARP